MKKPLVKPVPPAEAVITLRVSLSDYWDSGIKELIAGCVEAVTGGAVLVEDVDIRTSVR